MKTVVITGVSRGLGLILANTFQASGWSVLGTGRSARPENLDGSVQYQQFDASDPAACENFWKSLTAEQLGGAICLINNVGGYIGGGLLEAQPEDFAKQMQTNYFPAVYMTRGLAKSISKAKIINLISNNALLPNSTDEAYGASKAAQMHFFKSLQKEFKPDTYQITNLYPNIIATNDSAAHAIDPAELATFVLEQAGSQHTYYLPDVTLHVRLGSFFN
jgi:NAD(P)-dependent dehydrogenase (short-subunit alcohol dehydrogenase family)